MEAEDDPDNSANWVTQANRNFQSWERGYDQGWEDCACKMKRKFEQEYEIKSSWNYLGPGHYEQDAEIYKRLLNLSRYFPEEAKDYQKKYENDEISYIEIDNDLFHLEKRVGENDDREEPERTHRLFSNKPLLTDTDEILSANRKYPVQWFDRIINEFKNDKGDYLSYTEVDRKMRKFVDEMDYLVKLYENRKEIKRKNIHAYELGDAMNLKMCTLRGRRRTAIYRINDYSVPWKKSRLRVFQAIRDERDRELLRKIGRQCNDDDEE